MKPSAAPLSDASLPQLFRDADQESRQQQRRYISGNAAQLALILLAAAAAKFSFEIERGPGATDWAQFAAAGFFLSAAAVRTYLISSAPQADWYEMRAVAESVKSLAWRYAVGGEPFRIDELGDREADRVLIERLREVLEAATDTPTPSPEIGAEITPEMRSLRRTSLTERRDAYQSGRAQDQAAWYSAKARWNKSRARAWAVVQLIAELVGGLFALLTATGIVTFELTSFSATVVGAATAWSQTKKFGRRATAYKIAGQDLLLLLTLADEAETEESFATYVEQVEQACSREHTIWRAAPER